MTDSPRRDGPDPAQQSTQGYPGYTDPAYANPPLFGNHYQSPADVNPTQQLPTQWQQGGYDPSQTDQFGQPWPVGGPPQQPPNGPGSRLWLWALAGLAVLLVIGMVTALVIVNSSQQQTVVAPPIEPSFTTTTTPRTSSRAPAPLPPPETTTAPSESASATPGASEEVVYDVSGSGRAINITYIDDGGVLQTEFNVMLPWSKTVQLSEPANRSASVSIVNVGREVSCTITVGGSQISQKSGSGLTVCSALGGG